MNAQQKAKALFIKYSNYFSIWDAYSDSERLDNWGIEYTKLCAIIAVDEILNALNSDIIEYSSIYRYEENNYWNEVKKEIELL